MTKLSFQRKMIKCVFSKYLENKLLLIPINFVTLPLKPAIQLPNKNNTPSYVFQVVI